MVAKHTPKEIIKGTPSSVIVKKPITQLMKKQAFSRTIRFTCLVWIEKLQLAKKMLALIKQSEI